MNLIFKQRMLLPPFPQLFIIFGHSYCSLDFLTLWGNIGRISLSRLNLIIKYVAVHMLHMNKIRSIIGFTLTCVSDYFRINIS